METNDLGFVASLLFVLVPAVFLIVLYIQTSSRQGGWDPSPGLLPGPRSGSAHPRSPRARCIT